MGKLVSAMRLKMKKSQPLIDFAELVSAVLGEGLEQLTRQIGRRKGLSPTWSGRGPDSGRDLLFTEFLSGPLSKEKITWLVSCKDKAKSGQSVTEKDLPSPGIKDKLAQHKANGFLLVTTTTVSTGAKALLDSLDKSSGGDIHTLVWDSSELTAILLESSNQDLLKQFLPQSYQRVKGLTSLEGAILVFRDQLPDEVLAEVMYLVKPYSESPLKGSIIWPYDNTSAATIDQIVKHVLLKPNLYEAVIAIEEIEYEAFMTLVARLHERYPEECFAYLSAIVCQHHELDVRFNAAQFLFDNYEISPSDYIRFATHLDPDGLAELYGPEVISFVEQELYENTPSYDIYQSLDQLSSATQIEDIYVSALAFSALENRRIEFTGRMYVDVTFFLDGEKVGSPSFPGSFLGFFDAGGMYLEKASVDTRAYYEELDVLFQRSTAQPALAAHRPIEVA